MGRASRRADTPAETPRAATARAVAEMQIECTEERLSDLDQDTGTLYQLKKGDRVTVSAKYGARLCAFGWAKDVAGKVKSGERKPGAEELKVDKVKVATRGRTRG